MSTDSDEIIKSVSNYDILVPGLRPRELSSDSADQFDTHKYIFELKDMRADEYYCCVLNNNPFIDSKIIKESFLLAKKYDYQRLVLDYVKVPGDFKYFRQALYDGQKFISAFPVSFYESKINRQSSLEIYSAINNIRWGTPQQLDSYENFKKEIISNGYLGVDLKKTRNFDLDDLEDWAIAEAVMKGILNSEIR